MFIHLDHLIIHHNHYLFIIHRFKNVKKNIPYHLRDVNKPPDHLEEKQKKKWIKAAVKAKHNVELGEQYPPLNLPQSSYEIIHLHERTSDDDIQRLIKHIDSCYEFTLDCESDKTTRKLSLIQIQTIPKHLPMIVLLVAVQHLPAAHTPLHQQIKKIFDMIFKNKNKVLYSWGYLSTELEPIQRYKLFEWPINSCIINLQEEFPIWYSRASSRCEVCCLKFRGNSGSEYDNKIECRCHPKDPYRTNEKWAIQKALAYGAELFMDKSKTISEWSNLLDPKYTRLSTHECNRLIRYAIIDCFSVTCLIRPVLNKWSFQQVTNSRIIDLFQALTLSELKLLIQSRKEQQIIMKDKFYDGIMVISDEESEDEILVSSIINRPNAGKPTQDDTLSIYASVDDLNDDQNGLMVDGVDNHLVVIDDKNYYYDHREQRRSRQHRSDEARKRRNYRRNMKLRRIRYKHYFIRRLYYRFKSFLMRRVLKYYLVRFTHVKVVEDVLVIGVRSKEAKEHYERTVPRNCFNKYHFNQFRR